MAVVEVTEEVVAHAWVVDEPLQHAVEETGVADVVKAPQARRDSRVRAGVAVSRLP